MKIKYLLIFLLLLGSTSFSKMEPEQVWIGTIQVFFRPETNEFILYYDGNYHRCFTKFIIDEVYNDCDEMIDEDYLRNQLQLHPVENETIENIPIKTITM